jgi:hypothetical protein
MEAMCKTMKRNRLKSETVNKVVFICANMRLQQKNQAILYQEEHLQWFEAPAGADDGITADCNKSLIAKKVDSAEKKKEATFRDCFKPIGVAYTKGLVIKKLKSADGTPMSMDTQGVADKKINKNDTVIVPISQFAFTEKQIETRFGGDLNYLLRGVVTYVAKDTINIRFDGDQHV